MAAVEVTISGLLFDKLNRTTQHVVIVGDASLTGLGVGGGPIQPPQGGQPPGIWGPTDPRPTPPIAGIPGLPGSPGQQPHPEHPIVYPPDVGPPDGGQPPSEPGSDKPPPPQGGWGWVATWDDPSVPAQWGYFPGPQGAGPRR